MHRFAAVVVLFAATVLAQEPFELKTDGDTLTLAIAEGGVAMADFVKLAELVTGRSFKFSEKDIAASDPVKFTGSVRMKKDAFLQFFQTMAYIKGFDTVARGEGDSAFIEVVSARLPEDSVTDPRYVALTELEGYKTDTAMILTSIPLAHMTPQDAINRLHAVLAATATEVMLAKMGKTLLVQGAGAEVYRVSRMARLIDVPRIRVFEVVSLKHAAATELAAGLRALVAGREPEVAVLAHDRTNSLMISGPRAVVDEVVELSVLLDRPAKE